MNSVLGQLVGSLLLALHTGLASAANQLNFHLPLTRIGSEIYDLRMLMMYVILVIFCVVFGVMFYSIYAHRKSVGHKVGQFHEHTAVEIIWTLIPFLILVGMVWPATKALYALKDTAVPEITIKAAAIQCVEVFVKDYRFMPIADGVLSQQAYALWATEQNRETNFTVADPNKQWSADALTTTHAVIDVDAANCAAGQLATGTAFVTANTSGFRRPQASVWQGSASAPLSGDPGRQTYLPRRFTILSGFPNQTRMN